MSSSAATENGTARSSPARGLTSRLMATGSRVVSFRRLAIPTLLPASASAVPSVSSTVPSAVPSGEPGTAGDRHFGCERHDPHKFAEGLNFKGKLIGVLEVAEARGDRMCQVALSELKVAVRAAGEHKQKIFVSVALDGIRLRDERSGDCLYHHPVHKISFIAQDMTDTRAFGYIFGSPDVGHKFFGVKTEKAANQVVIAMRDLFQVVFEMKKKEIEKARAQLEESREGSGVKDGDSLFGDGDSIVSASLTGAGGPIADLLDLQSELSSLQKGLSEISQQRLQQKQKGEQMDPFGDSFRPMFPPPDSRSRSSTGSSLKQISLTLPPHSGRSRSEKYKVCEEAGEGGEGECPKFPQNSTLQYPSWNDGDGGSDWYLPFHDTDSPSCCGYDDEDFDASCTHSFPNVPKFHGFVDLEGQQDNNATGHYDNVKERPPFPPPSCTHDPQFPPNHDVFTDLDPLGGNNSRSYTDRRDFFSDLKRPPTRGSFSDDSDTSSPYLKREASKAASVTTMSKVVNSECDTVSDSVSHRVIGPPSDGVVALPEMQRRLNFSDLAARASDSFSSNDFVPIGGDLKEEMMASNLSIQHAVAPPPESFRDSPPSFSPPPVPDFDDDSPHDWSHPHSQVLHMNLSHIPFSPKTLPRNHRFTKSPGGEEFHEGFHIPPEGLCFRAAPSASQKTSSGLSPRPRPRSNLTRHLSASSGVLALDARERKFTTRSFSPDLGSMRTSSTGHFDSAPDPPPRPANTEPPPLPPKRPVFHATMPHPSKVGQRIEPRHSTLHRDIVPPGHIPPIPIPARRLPLDPPPKFSRGAIRQTSVDLPSVSMDMCRERLGSPPNRTSTPQKLHQARETRSSSVDLTSLSLDSLASTLNMPIQRLAKMTVVELAASIAQLQMEQQHAAADETKEKSGGTFIHDSVHVKRDDLFADFDAQFSAGAFDNTVMPNRSANVPGNKTGHPLGAPVSEDRYAVFRELSSTKQKSVFDDAFLTPQNSIDDDGSDASSGTFKVARQESGDQKSLSEDEYDLEKKELDSVLKGKRFVEGSAEFRSPEISEYDNCEFAEFNNDVRFDDVFPPTDLKDNNFGAKHSPVLWQEKSIIGTHEISSDANKSPRGTRKIMHSFSATPPLSRRSIVNEKLSRNERSFSGGACSSPRDSLSQNSFSRDSLSRVSFSDSFTDLEPPPESVSRTSSVRSQTPRPIGRRLSATRNSSGRRKSPFDDDFINTPRYFQLDGDSKGMTEGRVPSIEDEKSLHQRLETRIQSSPFDDEFCESSSFSDEGFKFQSTGNPIGKSPLAVESPEVNGRLSWGAEVEGKKVDTGAVVDTKSAKGFADFENAFHDPCDQDNGKMDDTDITEKNSVVIEGNLEDDDADVFPQQETEFRVIACGPKLDVEGKDIFRRDSDPFADDFFRTEPADDVESKSSHWKAGSDNITFATS